MLWRAIRAKQKWPVPAEIVVLAALLIAAALALDPRYGPQRWGGEHEQYVINQVTTNLGATLRAAITQNAHQLFSMAASDVLFQARLGAFNGVLSLLVLALGIGLFAENVLWGFWFSLVLVMVVLVLPLDRYFLPVIPLLVFQWWKLLTFLNRTLPRRIGNLVFLILLGYGTGMNGSKLGGIIIQQRWQPFLEHFDRGAFAVVPRFTDQLRLRTPQDAIVLVGPPYARVMSFLSRRTTVGAERVDLKQLLLHPVFVVEPAAQDIHDRLKAAGLTQGPAIFTAAPPPTAGPAAHSLTLHSTALAEHPFLP